MLQEPPSIVATPCQASVDNVCQWLKTETDAGLRDALKSLAPIHIQAAFFFSYTRLTMLSVFTASLDRMIDLLITV